jgi:hypothetical protein
MATKRPATASRLIITLQCVVGLVADALKARRGARG